MKTSRVTTSVQQETGDFVPLICADLELSDPDPPDPDPPDLDPPDLDPSGSDGLELLVRLHGEPLGELRLVGEDVAAGPVRWRFRAEIEFADRIREHLRADGISAPGTVAGGGIAVGPVHCARRLDPGPHPPSVVAVVCTMGTHPLLPRSVSALLDQDFGGQLKVLVVDNAPGTGDTVRALAGLSDARLEVIAERRPGLSRARNTGLRAAAAAGYRLVAFTDDDAIADPGWVRSIAAVHGEHPDVACVTGLVVAGSLQKPAEQLFETGTGFGKGFERRVWSRAAPSSPVWTLGPAGDGGPLFPFAAGMFGSGNNMSFDVTRLCDLGGFDEALGAGTPAAGGEDLDVFVRVILGGKSIVYEPRAIVRHFHRDTTDGLERQMFGYGSGLSAYLFRELVFLPAGRTGLLRAVPRGIARMFSPKSEKNEPRGSDYPRELARAERRGFLCGPWLYVRSRREARRMGRVRNGSSS